MSDNPPKSTIDDIFGVNKKKDSQSNPLLAKPDASKKDSSKYLFSGLAATRAENTTIPKQQENEKKKEDIEKKSEVKPEQQKEQPAKVEVKEQQQPANSKPQLNPSQKVNEGLVRSQGSNNEIPSKLSNPPETKQQSKNQIKSKNKQNKQQTRPIKQQSDSESEKDKMMGEDDQFLVTQSAKSKQAEPKQEIKKESPKKDAEQQKSKPQSEQPMPKIKKEEQIKTEVNKDQENKPNIKQKIPTKPEIKKEEQKKPEVSKEDKTQRAPLQNQNNKQSEDLYMSDDEEKPGTKKEEQKKPEVKKENKMQQVNKTQRAPVIKKQKEQRDDMFMDDEQDIRTSSKQSTQKVQEKQKQPIQKEPKKQQIRAQSKQKPVPNLKIDQIQNKSANQQKPATVQQSPLKKEANKTTFSQVSKNAYEDLVMQDDQEILQQQKQVSAHLINKPMKPFYEGLLQTIQDGKIGPQMLRFAQIQQKYLNQLRILIELNKISENQLRQLMFNRQKYKELVNQKSKVYEQNPFPQVITEEALNTQNSKRAMEKLEHIQNQLTPFEDAFDQRHINKLYAFPKEMLKITKQQLYEEMLQKEVQQLQKIYNKTQKETNDLQNMLEKKKNLLKENQLKQAQAAKQDEKLLQQHQEKVRKTVFPDSDKESRIIKQSEFRQEYKVIVKNRQEMNRKLQELRSDKELRQLKETIEKLIKERVKEEQQLAKEKEKFDKYNIHKKKNLNKEVYMGDVDKMRGHPKVAKLEKELKQLMKQYQQRQEQRANRQGSKISYNSGIRLVSRIEQ